MMASYVPSGASCTNLMPSVMCTFTRGSLKPSAISGKNLLEVSGTILRQDQAFLVGDLSHTSAYDGGSFKVLAVQAFHRRMPALSQTLLGHCPFGLDICMALHCCMERQSRAHSSISAR